MTLLIERGGLRKPCFRFSDSLLLFLRQALKHSALRMSFAGFNLLAVFERFALRDSNTDAIAEASPFW